MIDAIRFVIQNELALRGSWNIESHVEEGIFRNLFEYTLHKDAKLRTCQDAMPKNATYLSPLIQNELIEIIANLTRQEIVQEINSADAKFAMDDRVSVVHHLRIIVFIAHVCFLGGLGTSNEWVLPQ